MKEFLKRNQLKLAIILVILIIKFRQCNLKQFVLMLVLAAAIVGIALGVKVLIEKITKKRKQEPLAIEENIKQECYD